MRSRRSGRDHLSDIFYNVGDMNLSPLDDRFGFSREFTDATYDRMLREERLERDHRMEEERRMEAQYPSCRITDRPAGWISERDRRPNWGYGNERNPRFGHEQDRPPYRDPNWENRPVRRHPDDRPPRW